MNTSIQASSANPEWFVTTLCAAEMDAARRAGLNPYGFIDREVGEVGLTTRSPSCPSSTATRWGMTPPLRCRGCGLAQARHLLRGIYEGIAFNHRIHCDPLVEARWRTSGRRRRHPIDIWPQRSPTPWASPSRSRRGGASAWPWRCCRYRRLNPDRGVRGDGHHDHHGRTHRGRHPLMQERLSPWPWSTPEALVGRLQPSELMQEPSPGTPGTSSFVPLPARGGTVLFVPLPVRRDGSFRSTAGRARRDPVCGRVRWLSWLMGGFIGILRGDR